MRTLHRALLAGSLGLVVAFVAGCGGGAGLLSGDQASALQNQLDKVSSALSAGHCANVRSATRALADQVASLPSTINATLRQDLDQGASQVSTLAVQQCRPATNTNTTPTTPATTTTTTPTTTATTTTPTTPTTTTPATTSTPATTPTTPGTNSGSSGGGGLSSGSGGAPGSGSSGGDGNGNGNGNG